MNADGTFVSELAAQMRKPVSESIDGEYRTWLPAGWTEAPMPAQSRIARLPVRTLGAVRDYLASNVDQLNKDALLLHVESPLSVNLYERLEGEVSQYRRNLIITATAAASKFSFGQWQDIETFVIGIQTHFLDSGAREAVLKLVSSVKDVEELESEDDGVSQEVRAKAGAAFVERFKVQNPVVLAPFRTFREVDQPVSPFVLRLKRSDGNGGPRCALFEADGGAWELEAIAEIAVWLRRECADVAVIA